jgi:hypothetical protein
MGRGNNSNMLYGEIKQLKGDPALDSVSNESSAINMIIGQQAQSMADGFSDFFGPGY